MTRLCNYAQYYGVTCLKKWYKSLNVLTEYPCYFFVFINLDIEEGCGTPPPPPCTLYWKEWYHRPNSYTRSNIISRPKPDSIDETKSGKPHLQAATGSACFSFPEKSAGAKLRMYQWNRSVNIPPGHMLGIWRLFLPGREGGYLITTLGRGEFDR